MFRSDREGPSTQDLAPLRHARPRRFWNVAPSKTEADLRRSIASLAITERYRTSLRRQLYAQRDRIAAEKKRNHFASVLTKLRQGGWGKRALAPRMEPMTGLRLAPDVVTYDAEAIRKHATDYCTDLFSPEGGSPRLPGHVLQEELEVREFCAQQWGT